MQLTGAQIVVACLREQGVDTVFGYPGGTILDVYDALYQEPAIKHYLVSHEQGAAHAADGYARSTRRRVPGHLGSRCNQSHDRPRDRLHGLLPRRRDHLQCR